MPGWDEVRWTQGSRLVYRMYFLTHGRSVGDRFVWVEKLDVTSERPEDFGIDSMVLTEA